MRHCHGNALLYLTSNRQQEIQRVFFTEVDDIFNKNCSVGHLSLPCPHMSFSISSSLTEFDVVFKKSYYKTFGPYSEGSFSDDGRIKQHIVYGQPTRRQSKNALREQSEAFVDDN